MDGNPVNQALSATRVRAFVFGDAYPYTRCWFGRLTVSLESRLSSELLPPITEFASNIAFTLALLLRYSILLASGSPVSGRSHQLAITSGIAQQCVPDH